MAVPLDGDSPTRAADQRPLVADLAEHADKAGKVQLPLTRQQARPGLGCAPVSLLPPEAVAELHMQEALARQIAKPRGHRAVAEREGAVQRKAEGRARRPPRSARAPPHRREHALPRAMPYRQRSMAALAGPAGRARPDRQRFGGVTLPVCFRVGGRAGEQCPDAERLHQIELVLEPVEGLAPQRVRQPFQIEEELQQRFDPQPMIGEPSA